MESTAWSRRTWVTCGSFSVVAEKRPMIIDEAEQHFYTAEVILPSMMMWSFLRPSTNKTVPTVNSEAFIVPQNTLAVLKAVSGIGPIS